MEPRFTAQQVAEFYRVHIVTVWRWIKDGKLTASKIGGQYFCRQEDLEEFEANTRRYCCRAKEAPHA